MNGYPEMQHSIHRAARRIGITAELAKAIHQHLKPGEYLWCSDLAMRPELTAIVPTAEEMSVLLSDAYRRNLVGRIYDRRPGTQEKFRYGHVGATSVVFSHKVPGKPRNVIQPPPKKVVGYQIRRQFADANQALRAAAESPGCTISAVENTGWIITTTYPDAAAALMAVAASVGINVQEVTE